LLATACKSDGDKYIPDNNRVINLSDSEQLIRDGFFLQIDFHRSPASGSEHEQWGFVCAAAAWPRFRLTGEGD